MELINLQNTPTPDSVQIQSVTFKSAENTLKGIIYRPVDSRIHGNARLPAVVVTGAWTTVKEQMAGTYARELAIRGMIALSFDFTGWGESNGNRRYVEDPVVKIHDIHEAVAFLSSRNDVDSATIYGLGICASSGYIAEVAADNDQLTKFALVAPWLHDHDLVNKIYGGVETVDMLIAESEARARSDTPKILVAASSSDESSPMFQAPYYTEKDRGLISEYDNRFSVLSWKPWLTFNSHLSASRLKKPCLMVGSDGMALPAGAEAYEQATRAPLKKVWLASDINQFDFYDRKDIVIVAVDAVANFFKT